MPGARPLRDDNPGRTRNLQGILEAAVRYHRAGELREAAALYRKALKLGPNNPDVLHLYGIVSHQTGKSAAAVKHLRQSLALRPDAPDVESNLGNVLKELGRHEEAIAHFRKALEIRPDYAEAHNNLGNTLHDLGRIADAIRHYREALSLNPRSPGTCNNLGVALKEQGKLDEAAKAYEKAISLAPDYAPAHVNLGNVLAERGRPEEAAVRYEKAIAINPGFAEAHIGLGKLRRAQGRLDEAAAHFRRALALKPDLPEILGNLGNLLALQGKTAEGLGNLERALALDPDLADARRGFVAIVRHAASGTFKPAFALLLRECFSRPEVDDRDLARATANQLKLKYGISGDPAADSRFDASAWAARLGADELFLVYLEKTVNVDPDLERLLTGLRRGLLLRHGEGSRIPKAEMRFLSALAQQCINNEYVFFVEEDETRALALLKRRIERSVDEKGVRPSQLEPRLLLFALYEPLRNLACAEALAATGLEAWSPRTRPLIERTLTDRLREEEIAETIPSIASVIDATSLAVMAQYEENPYPRWISVPLQAPRPYADVVRQDFPHFSPPPFLEGPVRVLVAGCGTGRHPINVALAYEGAEVTAVDLSRRSLAYGMRMAERLGVTNIRFLQGDVLELARLGRQFHVVESIGVLHHMEDPAEGWSVLTECLMPGGILEIGLYSQTARQNIVQARARIREMGLTPSPDDIRAFRRRLLSGAEGDALASLMHSEDFYSTSGFRDLLLNVKEHRFTLAKIEELIARHGMTFIGFVLPGPAIAQEYRRLFPDDPAMTDLASWSALEDDFPNAFSELYQFLCQMPAEAV